MIFAIPEPAKAFFGQEGRHALGQQPVQQLDRVGAEVGQGVVVDCDVAEEPAIGVVVAAESVELAGAADAVDGGVGPQRHEDLGIDGGPAGIADDRLDGVVQGAEVQPPDELPDDPGGVIGGDQVVEGAVSFGVPAGEEFVPRLFAELRVPIRSVSVSRPTLDDVFMSYTGTTIRDAEEDPAKSRNRTMMAVMGRR